MTFGEKLRVYRRILLIAINTTAWFALRLLAYPVTRLNPAWDRGIRAFILYFWGRWCIAIAGVRVHIEGTPPRRPFFMVSNHLSFMDIIILAAHTRAVFVSKAEVAGWPVVGFITRMFGTLYIDRSLLTDTKRVNDLIAGALESGEGVVVFAEAGIGPGDRILPFKTALLQPAVHAETPVHHAAITYRTPEGSPPASESVRWKEGMPFGEAVTNLLRLPRAEAYVSFGNGPIAAENRKQLARDLWEAVQGRFTPLD